MPRYHDLKSTENDPALLDRALRYLAEQEGFVARPQLDPNKKQYNIGYGSKIDTSNPTWKKRTITQTEAKALLKDDFMRHREYARQALADAGYKTPSGRVLDGFGLLFFNTNWNKLAEGKRFQEAAKTAAAGNEDPLITYAQGIDKVNGKWDENIAARRTAESKYMLGGNLPVREQNARAKLQWNRPEEKPTATPSPTPVPTPPSIAATKEGPTLWDRLKRYGESAADFAFGTNLSQASKEKEALAKYRDGKSTPDAKPTPSTPIAAAEKAEPEVKPEHLAGQYGEDTEAVHDKMEQVKRAGAKLVADAVLDPEFMNELAKVQKDSGKSFEQELMEKIWMVNHPGETPPETITEKDLPVAAAISPAKGPVDFGEYEERMAPYKKAVSDSYARTRDLIRKKRGETPRPDTTPSPSPRL